MIKAIPIVTIAPSSPASAGSHIVFSTDRDERRERLRRLSSARGGVGLLQGHGGGLQLQQRLHGDAQPLQTPIGVSDTISTAPRSW